LDCKKGTFFLQTLCLSEQTGNLVGGNGGSGGFQTRHYFCSAVYTFWYKNRLMLRFGVFSNSSGNIFTWAICA
jgi:hypothetical protein